MYIVEIWHQDFDEDPGCAEAHASAIRQGMSINPKLNPHEEVKIGVRECDGKRIIRVRSDDVTGLVCMGVMNFTMFLAKHPNDELKMPHSFTYLEA